MSIRALDTVFHSNVQDQSDLLILLALADWADDDGYCYPSLPRIAAKARVSKRTVQDKVKQMEERGWIDREQGGGRGVSSRYWLQLEAIKSWNPEEQEKDAAAAPYPAAQSEQAGKGATAAPFISEEEKGATGDTKRVQMAHEKGAELLPPNHHIEPSLFNRHTPLSPPAPKTGGFDLKNSGSWKIISKRPTCPEGEPPMLRDRSWPLLMAIGMPEEEARRICRKHTDGEILRQLAFLEYELCRGKRVTSRPGMLAKMVEQDWKLPPGAEAVYERMFGASASGDGLAHEPEVPDVPVPIAPPPEPDPFLDWSPTAEQLRQAKLAAEQDAPPDSRRYPAFLESRLRQIWSRERAP